LYRPIQCEDPEDAADLWKTDQAGRFIAALD